LQRKGRKERTEGNKEVLNASVIGESVPLERRRSWGESCPGVEFEEL
jgi:hypothetical protein